MRSEDEIKRELKLADQYYKLVKNTRIIHSHYYSEGYKTALEVVLGLRQSELKDKIKAYVDFDLLKEILEDNQ